MARFFRTAERRQAFLLPVDMQDWLPEDDIVHLIVDAVSLMDLREFEAAHRLGGAQAGRRTGWAARARRPSRRGCCWPC